MSLVDLQRLPRHIGIIMDGNGRWAQAHGWLRTEGHRRGSDAVRRIVRASRRLGIRALTLYAFSEQNWSRSREEVDALMALLRDFLVSERAELLENGIRLRAIGRLHKLPESVLEVLDPLMRETASFDGMVLTLALSYGGQEELADAAQRLAIDAAEGRLDPRSIDVASFGASLPSIEGVGPVDLLIRTSGEQRISNFLLWASSYAELCFTPRLWPEFEAEDLFSAVEAFQSRDRRFGAVHSDVDPAPASRPA